MLRNTDQRQLGLRRIALMSFPRPNYAHYAVPIVSTL